MSHWMTVWRSDCLIFRHSDCLTVWLTHFQTVWLSDCVGVWLFKCLTVWVSEIILLIVTVNNVTRLNATRHNARRTQCKEHLWLRPSACSKVNRAVGPERSSSIVSGPRLYRKALCQQAPSCPRTITKKILLFVEKPIVECFKFWMSLCLVLMF